MKGIKRHVLTDHLGLLLRAAVHPADVQDGDGVRLVLDTWTRRRVPFIEVICGDGGYQSPRVAETARRTGTWRGLIVKRLAEVEGFHLLPKRCIVERTLACISRNRRLARDVECLAPKALGFIHLAISHSLVPGRTVLFRGRSRAPKQARSSPVHRLADSIIVTSDWLPERRAAHQRRQQPHRTAGAFRPCGWQALICRFDCCMAASQRRPPAILPKNLLAPSHASRTRSA